MVQKQLLRLDTSPTEAFATGGNSLNYKELDAGDILGTAPIATAMTEYQGAKRYFKEVAYCRTLSNQYGGNTYIARSKYQYIDTGHYQPVTSETGSTFQMFLYLEEILMLPLILENI